METPQTQEINKITEKVIASAIEVHKHLGAGLLESVYEECLFYELKTTTNFKIERQKEIPVICKGAKLDCAFRADLIIEDKVILELKSINEINNVHKAQLNTYLRLTNCKVGLILNFNAVLLKNGIFRWVN
jgi:GxxExxY protein